MSKKPLLLGFSGGIDSMSLFYLLEEVKKQGIIDFEVAHLDHGWRKESSVEALNLKRFCLKRKIPFHLKKAHFSLKKDLENSARQKRYQFFLSLMQKNQYEALVLAHQKEDLAETVLKRILEGAHLSSLFGMKPVSSYENICIWRPLLDISKEKLKSFLDQKKAFYIEDKTNFSEDFLRGRMRSKIMPCLKEEFGKEFLNNLQMLSQRSLELKNYWDKKIDPLKKQIHKSPIGSLIQKEVLLSFDKLELVYFFKFWLEKEKIEVTRNMTDRIIDWLLAKKSGSLKFKDKTLFMEKEVIILLNHLPLLDLKSSSLKSKMQFPHFSILKIEDPKMLTSLQKPDYKGWKSLFMHQKIYLEVPQSVYALKGSKKDSQYLNPKIKKLYTKAQVPVCLRGLFPILLSDNDIAYDFLSSQSLKMNDIVPKMALLLQLHENE